MEERDLAPTSDEWYRRLLRLHLLPTFHSVDLDEITSGRVRAWRAERLEATGATTVAKSYRLLKTILETATDDELLRRNPCRIKGAGKEKAQERPIAGVEQVDAVAEAMGPRWRLMVYFAAYGSLRPEEQAELRRSDVTLPDEPDELRQRRDVTREPVLLRIVRASPELTTGRRATADPKSPAGRRVVDLPGFLTIDVRRTSTGSRRRKRTACFSSESVEDRSGVPPSGANGGRPARKSACLRASASTASAIPGTPSSPSRAAR